MSVSAVPSAPSSKEPFQTPGISQNTIGDRLQSLNADQINRIARKMVEILSKNVNPINNPLIQIPQVNPSTRKIDLVQGKDAKTEFLNQTASLFAQRMTIDFKDGPKSRTIYDIVTQYSFSDMLNFCTNRANYKAIEEAIGAELRRNSNYTIRVGLDFDQTTKRSELVFQVTEYNSMLVSSKTSFALSEI